MTLAAFTTAHYADLLAQAERLMPHRESSTTAGDLLHESYLRLACAQASVVLNDPAHGRRLYHRAMQRTLMDRARKRLSQRRGGNCPHVDVVSLRDTMPLAPSGHTHVIVNDALDYVARQLPEGAYILRHRCLHGYTQREVASQLRVSLTTLKRYKRQASHLLATV